jgi:WD40 repeat protein
MSRKLLAAALYMGLILYVPTVLSQTVNPGAPRNVAACKGVIENPTMIGYTLAADGASCCHGPTGSERAFIVDVVTGKTIEVGEALALPPRVTEFAGWLPCRQTVSIALGIPEDRADPASPKCGVSKCYIANTRFDGYFVDIQTGKYWSPVWTSGPFSLLGTQNYGMRPIYKDGALQGYFLGADGTLLTMLPDGTSKAKTPLPANGHGCSFTEKLVSCQVGDALKVFDRQFNELSTIRAKLTIPVGIWSPNGEGLLYFDGNRPGPHYVTYWSAKENQSYRLGSDADYDLDCELNGNCFGFLWGTELPDWSPDGTKAYFSVPDPSNKLKRILGWVDVSTPESRTKFHPLTKEFGQSARYPTVSPDGRSVAFVSVSDNPNEGTIQLFVLRLPNGKPKQVTHAPKGYIVGSPSWR